MVKRMGTEKRVQSKKVICIKTVTFFFFTIIFLKGAAMAETKKYTITKREDGGYVLSIRYSKRIWKPITAEGVFPKEEGHYELNMIGVGEDWSNEGTPGFFYPIEKIESKKKHWEIGFAWINKERTLIHINLFWVSPPNELIPMPINGEYKINL